MPAYTYALRRMRLSLSLLPSLSRGDKVKVETRRKKKSHAKRLKTVFLHQRSGARIAYVTTVFENSIHVTLSHCCSSPHRSRSAHTDTRGERWTRDELTPTLSASPDHLCLVYVQRRRRGTISTWKRKKERKKKRNPKKSSYSVAYTNERRAPMLF